MGCKTLAVVVLLMSLPCHALAAASQWASYVVTYAPASAALNEDQQRGLGAFYEQHLRTGVLDEVQMAAWSDRPFPLRGGERPEDEDLARQRLMRLSEVTARYVEADAIQAFNMARESHLLSKLLRTDEVRLKELFQKPKTQVWEVEEKLRPFLEMGGEGKAVVVIEMRPVGSQPLAH